MSWKQWIVVGVMSATLGWVTASYVKDFKITPPKRSHLTAVQRLNQEGVVELHKHRYEKAETLFYKAYLLDPDDPFTLNNLGYIAELQGQVDRAQRFYQLAGEQATDAVVYRASSSKVEGRTMKERRAIPNRRRQVNRDNWEEVR